MQKASMEPLDSCEESILNETGGRPVGDELCAKAAKHAGDNREQFNITVIKLVYDIAYLPITTICD